MSVERRAASSYASDLTDGEWSALAPLLPPAVGGGRKRSVVRRVLNAIFYRVRTGCAWRLLPRDFPPPTTVSEYFSLCLIFFAVAKQRNVARLNPGGSVDRPIGPTFTMCAEVDNCGDAEQLEDLCRGSLVPAPTGSIRRGPDGVAGRIGQ